MNKCRKVEIEKKAVKTQNATGIQPQLQVTKISYKGKEYIQ